LGYQKNNFFATHFQRYGFNPFMLSAIIVAAGSGRRMGFDKLLAPLGDSTVLAKTIQCFENTSEVKEIIVVCPIERFQKLGIVASCNMIRVDGGAERHHSVKNGLDVLSTDSQFVLIHDGARPLITKEAIKLCYQKARETGAAALARPVTETIKRVSAEQEVIESVSRDNLWFMETPQIFQTELIRQAYAEVEAQDQLVTDEVSALQVIGRTTTLVTSPCFNPKITYPADLELAQKFIHDGTTN